MIKVILCGQGGSVFDDYADMAMTTWTSVVNFGGLSMPLKE